MSFLMKQAGTWHALSAKSGDMCLNAGGTADNVIIRPGIQCICIPGFLLFEDMVLITENYFRRTNMGNIYRDMTLEN